MFIVSDHSLTDANTITSHLGRDVTNYWRSISISPFMIDAMLVLLRHSEEL